MRTGGRTASSAALSLVAAACLSICLQCADAHGFLTKPEVEFRTTNEDPTAYSATIDGATALPPPDGVYYGRGPSLSAEAFAAAFGNSTYKTLREFVMKHQVMEASAAISHECGRTKQDVKAQPLPAKVVWQHGDNEGFTLSHEGPCEIWCDNERVFAEPNCAKTYPDIPARLPFERAKCLDKQRLQFVWLALHEGTRWQVYMNCAPITSKRTGRGVPGPSTGPGSAAPKPWRGLALLSDSDGVDCDDLEGCDGDADEVRETQQRVAAHPHETAPDQTQYSGTATVATSPTPRRPVPQRELSFLSDAFGFFVSDPDNERGVSGDGSIDADIYEEAREDLKEIEVTAAKKEDRRNELKKEFGYA